MYGQQINPNQIKGIPQYAQTVGPTLSQICSSFSGNQGQVIVAVPVTSGAATLPANCAITVTKGGVITVSSGTLTINGPFAGPSVGQIFAGAGTIAGLSVGRPEWYGSTATICTAINALGSNGGDIYLNVANYRSGCDVMIPNDPTSIAFMTKANVHVHGAARGVYNGGFTHISGGTIIQGGFYIRASGFHIENLSVDAGSEVMAAFYPGYTTEDSLLITGAIPLDPTHYPNLTGIVINNVNCLGQSATSADHCMLVEDVDGAYVTNVQTAYHTHGFVLKGIGSHIDGVYARGSSSECIVFKSDSYAPTSSDSLTNSTCASLVAAGDGAGVQIYAASAPGGSILLSNIVVDNTTYGLKLIADSTLGTVDVQGFIYNGQSLATPPCVVAAGVGLIGPVMIDNFQCNNSGGLALSRGIVPLTLSNGYLGATTGDAISLGADAQLSNINVNVASGHGITQAGGFIARVSNFIGTTTLSAFSGTVIYTDSFVYQTPSFVNGWTAFGGGNSTTQYKFDRGRIYLKGLYRPGTAPTVFNLPAGNRPLEIERLTGLGFNGTAWGICEVLIATNGDVSVTNYATCSTGSGSYVSMDGISFPVVQN
jgi:hypothetical protein